MVFEGSNRAFGCIPAMDVWWYYLEVDGTILECGAYCCGAFVIYDVEFRVCTMLAEGVNEFGECSFEFMCRSILDGFNEDRIAWLVV